MEPLANSFTSTVLTQSPIVLATSLRNSQTTLSGLLILGSVLLVVVVGIGIYFLVTHYCSRPLNNSAILLRDLCRAHQMTKLQSRLLQRLATSSKLDNPSVLFIDSSLWKIPSQSTTDDGLTKREWDQLQELRRMLFQPASVNRSRATS